MHNRLAVGTAFVIVFETCHLQRPVSYAEVVQFIYFWHALMISSYK